MGVTTDILTKLFSNDNPAVRSIRDIGLGLVDRVPSLKSFFIKQAAGLSGDTPPPFERRAYLSPGLVPRAFPAKV